MKNKSLLMYAAIVVFAIFVIGGIIATIKSASFQMQLKSTVSNYTGGLDRTVTVYDYGGKPIQSWSGKFDISETENEMFFDDENGKRVIIQNGIVIVEEK